MCHTAVRTPLTGDKRDTHSATMAYHISNAQTFKRAKCHGRPLAVAADGARDGGGHAAGKLEKTYLTQVRDALTQLELFFCLCCGWG